MEIVVKMRVKVDPEAWTATYGVEGARAIRDDVKSYVTGLVGDSAAASECDLQVVG